MYSDHCGMALFQAPPRAAANGHLRARILVVEDDPIFHELIVKIVRRSGHEGRRPV
jgi:hypothetical protein